MQCASCGLPALQGGFEAAPPNKRCTGRRRSALSDEPKRVTNLEIVRQNTALITYADGTAEDRDTRTLRQDDATTSAWMLARAALDATASEFACAALDESPFLSRAALLDRKLNKAVPTPVDTPATRFGRASEPLAVQAYRDKTGFDVRATGLYTCDELRYGASPDGVVVDRATGEEGLLEVKCLYRERRASYVSAAKPPARFVAQVQGQLASGHGHAWCDLAIWIPPPDAIFRVARCTPARSLGTPSSSSRLVAFSDERRSSGCRARHPCGICVTARPPRPRSLSPRPATDSEATSDAGSRSASAGGANVATRRKIVLASRNSSSTSPLRASSTSPSSSSRSNWST